MSDELIPDGVTATCRLATGFDRRKIKDGYLYEAAVTLLDGPFAGATVPLQLWETAGGLWFLHKMMESLGMAHPTELRQPPAGEFVFRAVVGVRKGLRDRPMNVVTKVEPIDADAVPVVTGGATDAG